MHLSKDWIQEGITPPNIGSKNTAMEICINLYNDYGLLPLRIAPTKEGGVFISFKRFDRNWSLFLEVYNNLEVAALVNDDTNKSIICSEDIKGLNFTNVIEKFVEN